MGFSAKMIVLFEDNRRPIRSAPVRRDGDLKRSSSDKSRYCTVWYRSGVVIDFDRITRLEKVVSPHFQHISFGSFERAGICVVDALLGKLFERFDDAPRERLAPEFLIPRGLFDDDIKGTTKVAGKTYVECSGHRLGGFLKKGDELITQHNEAVRLDDVALKDYLEKCHIFMDGPFLWAPCAELVAWMQEAASQRTAGWRALCKDKKSLAIALGWHSQLKFLSNVGARVLFVFS